MKKAIALIIAAILVLSFCACDSGGSTSGQSQTHIGEWHLDGYEWRSGEVEGLKYSEANLSLRSDGSFSLTQTVVKDGETGTGTLSGTYTLEGASLMLRSTYVTASGGGQNYSQEISPARITNAAYNGDTIVINFTTQDSPYFRSATLRR